MATNNMLIDGMNYHLKYSGHLGADQVVHIPSGNSFIGDCLVMGAYVYMCIINPNAEKLDVFEMCEYSYLFKGGLTSEKIEIATEAAKHKINLLIDKNLTQLANKG